MNLSTVSLIKDRLLLKRTFESLLLIFISFGFVFKVNIATPALLVLLFLNLNIKKEHIISLTQKYLTIVFFAFYLLFIASFLINGESNTTIIKSLGFIYIPLLFYFKRLDKNEILVFLYSFSIFQILHLLYVDYVMIDAIFIDKIKDYDSLTALVQNKFIIERPYFSLNCLLLMIGLKFIYDEKKINLFTSLFLFLFITTSLFLIGARLAMGVSILLFFVILMRSKVNKKHFILLIASFFVLLIPISNYTLDRIFLKRGEPRIVIWDCAVKIIKEKEFNYLIGNFSEEKTKAKLIECYNTKEVITGPYWWIATHNYNYNTHNQFLGLFISYGLLGLSTFLLIFAIQLYDFIKKDNFISLLIIAVFFFQCVFENILSRNLGIYLFIWFNYLFISQKKQYE